MRGLLYRARTTLRTGVTALTPPPLLGWLVGRSDQGGPAPERLAELAGGGGRAVGVGGAAGVSGLLLKGGAVALTVGTVITGAAVVHLGASTLHGRHRLIASAALPEWRRCGLHSAPRRVGGPRRRALGAPGSGRASRCLGAGRGGAGSAGGKTRGRPKAGGGGSAGTPTVSGGDHAPPSTTRVTGDAHDNAPAKTPGWAESGARLDPGVQPGRWWVWRGIRPGVRPGWGIRRIGLGLGRSRGLRRGQRLPQRLRHQRLFGKHLGLFGRGRLRQRPVGLGIRCGSGSGSGSGTGSSEGSGSGGSSGGSSGSSGSESSGGEQSGSLVGTVVHEVGSILEHLLH